MKNPNKNTLFKLVAGLSVLSAGIIWITHDRDLSESTQLQHQVDEAKSDMADDDHHHEHEASVDPFDPLAITSSVPRYSKSSNQVRFKAQPERDLNRAMKETMLYPEMQVRERVYQPGKVFSASPLQNVSTTITGSLSQSEITASVVEAELDLGVIEEFMQSDAEFLSLPINEEDSLNVSVQRTYDRGEHTVTLFGSSSDQQTNETLLVFHDGVMYGTIHEVNPHRIIEYASAGNGLTAIRELDTEGNVYGTCGLGADCPTHGVEGGSDALESAIEHGAISPEIDGLPAGVSADIQESAGTSSDQAGVNNDGITYKVDVVVTYSQSAADTLGGVSATEAKIIAHIDSTTELFNNSQLNDTAFYLLGTGLETVASGGIVRPNEAADHNTLQAQLGADISGRMYVGGGGSAWTPGGNYVYEGFIFGSNFAASTGSSFPHEICHNFGANHSYGDGGYNNDLVNEIHYGWRMRVQGYNYRTVMSYTTAEDVYNNSLNSAGPRIGYLSDPDQNYDAVADNVGGTISVPLGAAVGYDGSLDPYMDPSLLYGGGSAAFSYADNPSFPGDFSEGTFTYVSGGNITNGYDGTYTTLGANNNERVGGRRAIHANHQTRATEQFVIQPLASYSSTEEIDYAVFAGDHTTTVSFALHKAGQFVMQLETDVSASLRNYSFLVPETGLISGNDYQIYATIDGGTVLQSNTFSLNILEMVPFAHYKLDETLGTTLHDSSGNGFDATLLSGNLGAIGAIDEALEIDADDSNANRGFSIPSAARSQISDAITVMFWAFGDDSLPRANSIVSGPGLNLHLPWDNGWIYWDAGSGSGTDRLSGAAATTQYKERWNHYAFTKNSSTGEMKIYINGEEFATSSGNTLALAEVGDFYIGSANGVGVNSWDGLIDDVQLFDVAISQSKVQQIFSATTVPSMYWTGTAGDSQWETANNWSTGVAPVSGDVAAIDNGDNVEMISSLILPENSTILVDDATLDFQPSAGINLPSTSAMTIRGGNLVKDYASDPTSVSIGSGSYRGAFVIESGAIQLTGANVATLACSLHAGITVKGGDIDISVQTLFFNTFTVDGDEADINLGFLNAISGSTLEFQLDADGVSPMVTTSWASVANAALVVDGTNYSGGAARIPLVQAGSLLNTFTNITLQNFSPDLGLVVTLDQSSVANEIALVLTDNTVDSDGDGVFDWQEDIVGTSNSSPDSIFKPVVLPGNNSNEITMQWETVAGRSYTIEYAETLGPDATWLVYQENVPFNTGEGVSINLPSDAATNPKRFYRVVISR
ncbi:LamG-like jellyroll fold domain-containing protein [Rubritalea marina]|uniref:LamG-like jellyroll fold domain-containing protein n=1 Tax=Rubritalea marina TaxID=361055 RepID=UPI00036D97A6|nr:LamG-like jellyroll fold domain-containing protein [Rubritalea marina]